MDRVRLIIYRLVIVSITIFMLWACDKKSEQIVTLYYSSLDKMFFVPISTTLKISGEIENISKNKDVLAILEELKVSRDSRSLTSCIPDEVKFESAKIDKEKKEIEVFLNSSKERLTEAQEQLMIGAIVNTLTEIKGIMSVKIYPGNLKSEMDYSEPITKDSYKSIWFVEDNFDPKNSISPVYWFSKDKKYFVPSYTQIPKKDITSLLRALKRGPLGSRKNYFENSINNDLDIIIKAVNLHHIDIELKSKKDLSNSTYENAKKAITLSIYDLNIFDTLKFITPFSKEDVIDLTTNNPKKDINRIEFFVGGSKE
jgi:spore germination protein GerM